MQEMPEITFLKGVVPNRLLRGVARLQRLGIRHIRLAVNVCDMLDVADKLTLYRETINVSDTIDALTVVHDRVYLRAIYFANREEQLEAHCQKWYPTHTILASEGSQWSQFAMRYMNALKDHDHINIVTEWEAFANLPMEPRGTPHQRRVWAGLRQIPIGETISYQTLAQRIGNPKACRAVGTANGANPISIAIPCHRVISADGSLGGYGGGLTRKSWLLAAETGAAGLI